MSSIDLLIYRMKTDDIIDLPIIPFQIDKGNTKTGKTRFSITDKGVFVHESFLFTKLHVLRLFKKNGPAIGDCVTAVAYKGKSIYPFVINYIAKKALVENETSEVFILVTPENLSSIRGIEKAGFKLYSKVKAKRFLLFYFKVQKKLF